MQRQTTTLTQIVRAFVPRALRNALRKPGTTLDRIKLKLRRMRGEVAEAQVLPEWRTRCHPLCVSEFEIFRRDREQEQEMRSFIERCQPGMRLLDIGTHWGVFTLAALRHGGAAARVVGIEASHEAAEIYRDNISLNDGSDRTTLIEAACGSTVGELQMLTTGAGGADYLVVPAEDRPDTITVAQVSVDHVCEQQRFEPTHLKIDVEGFEEEVLLGAASTLSRSRPVIFLELHGDLIARRGKEAAAVLNLLRKNAYCDWRSVDGAPLTLEHLKKGGCNARFIALPAAA